MSGLGNAAKLTTVAGQAFRRAEQDVESRRLVSDQVISRIWVRNSEIAELVEHCWLGNSKTRRHVGGCQIEIDQRNA